MARRGTSVAIVFAVCALTGGAAASALASDRTDDFVRHQDTYWVWFGPADWVSTSSAYGISILAPPRDGSSIDYGGSTVYCDGAPEQHFAAQRQSFAATPGLRKVRERKVSPIRLSGATYAQTLKWTARANGIPIAGRLGMQYSSYDGTYCYQATLYKAARDNRRLKRSLRTLDAIWDQTAYSGPGLPINPDTGLP